MLKNLYIHRSYLLGSFWADFRYRYAGTAMGFFWFILTPLFEVVIYSIVFSQLITLRSGGAKGISYTLFLITALFPWLAFAHMITRGSNSLNSQIVYLRRLSIPPDVFVAKDVLYSFFSLLVYLIILIIAAPFMGGILGWSLLYLPILSILFCLLGFGFSLTVAHLRVLFPDLGEVLNVLVNLWRWTLPIMYVDDGFPDALRAVMRLNPPYYFIKSFRGVFLDSGFPTIEAWLYMLLWVVISLVIGGFVARGLRHEVKDMLS